jgi:hypothetical protein
MHAGLFIVFDDGKYALFPASLLHEALPQAVTLPEMQEGDEE